MSLWAFIIVLKLQTMTQVQLDSKKIIGIKVRTTNANMQAAKDIPALWAKFMGEQVMEKIPNKLSTDIFSIYTNYESDYQGAYDTVLGCEVSSDASIPEGMVTLELSGGNYKKYLSEGKLSDNIVYNTWSEIWNTPLDRSYQTDYEVYGAKAQNPDDATVEIYVGVE